MYLIVNFIMKLPLVVKKDMILVVWNGLFKIAHLVAITKEMSVESLTKLFRDNVQKLYGLSESVILDRRLQFAVDLTKELNKMLGIKTKLSTLFHLQIDSQTE